MSRKRRIAQKPPVLSPVVPQVDESSICERIYVRAYVETTKRPNESTRQHNELACPRSWFDGEFFVIDTETVNHAHSFAVYERYKNRKCIERAVFCRDDLPSSDPAGFQRLQQICIKLQLKMYLASNVFSSHIWRMRKTGGTFVFFNANYDLSRLATSWQPAAAKGRKGARFLNGFELLREFESWVDRDGNPRIGADGEPESTLVRQRFARIRRDDRHHVRYDMGRAHVLDLATLTHALTDQTYRLQDACKALGVTFDERPGEHDGTINEENVLGCLYDVAKTSELLFAAGAEYDRHPINVPPWRAQSGASLAKGYIRAFGVAPRSVLQPDFSKEHQGIAASTYFGGRVECRIVGEPMPVMYIDAVSMYPAVFDLLDLWFGQVIPRRLDPVDIDPQEIETLLFNLRQNPRLLLDRAMWPRLAFFAQVDPNGAQLPARPDVPSPYASREALARKRARVLFEQQRTAQAPYWDALDACGGKIVPDVEHNQRRKKWLPTGEFALLPKELLARNPGRTTSGKVPGNLNRIVRKIRGATNDASLTPYEILAFFASHQRPSLEAALQRVQSEMPDDGDAAAHRLVTIGPVTSHVPLWYAGPDLAAAAISGSAPRIVRAWRMRPSGVQSTLHPVDFRGDPNDRIDPARENPFRRLIELRKRKSGNTLDDDLRSTGFKVIANSAAYGCFVETTPEDIDPKMTRKPTSVHVWGLHEFETVVDRPEKHSALCSFPIASLVTAGARLLLAVAQKLVHDLGGEVAYCDTDSLFIVATPEGGFIPCTHGPYLIQNGQRTVRAISWAQVDGILADLAALKVFNLEGSSFKIEDVCLDVTGQKREVLFLGVREKAYCLYVIGIDGTPVPVKTSAHSIGQYRSPYPNDRDRLWIGEAWTFAIQKLLGMPADEPPWLDLPATSQLTLSTATLMAHYQATSGPFDFVAVAQFAFPGFGQCCSAPRPSCMLYPDARQWSEQQWRCLSCGAPIDPFIHGTSQCAFKSYRRVIATLARPAELKRLGADGREPAPSGIRGLTMPRPVHVASVQHIGKEVIVDETDADEDFTAEMLSATALVIYTDPSERLDALRADVRNYGTKPVARVGKVSRTQVQAFLNGTTKPRAATLAKVESAILALKKLNPTALNLATRSI
jgi:hypothetical protein